MYCLLTEITLSLSSFETVSATKNLDGRLEELCRLQYRIDNVMRSDEIDQKLGSIEHSVSVSCECH